MRDGDELAALAALIGEPARSRMLTALMGGIALTATELALEAGVAASTASAHLAKLLSGDVLAIERQGRHRYYRLAGPEVAALLESLAGVALPGARRRTGPADPALRKARVCYDHLAGERGVWLCDTLRARGLITAREGALTAAGEVFCRRFGIDLEALARSRRVFSRLCLDWSERRPHLGGALGAAILERMLTLRWAQRQPGSRAVELSPRGERELLALCGGRAPAAP
jgi:DNA-binding transcriptional ArsR family regulator